jgi:hypothetical protein
MMRCVDIDVEFEESSGAEAETRRLVTAGEEGRWTVMWR